jgi:hypothetical protein
MFLGSWMHDVRMAAVDEALSAGCACTLILPDGNEVHVPMFMAADAAVAAMQGKSEAEWRMEWTRRQLGRAMAYPGNSELLEEVATILNATESIIREQREAGVWPWSRRAVRKAG